MPALGVGQTCSLVGKYMGKKIDLATTSIKESIRIALYIMSRWGSLLLFPSISNDIH